MRAIRITDITKSHLAVSAADGEKVFELVVESFDRDEEIMLDFDGIKLTITAFMNAGIGKLYGKYDGSTIRRLLDIKNLQQEETQLLKLVIDRAKKRFDKTYPESLNNIDLFNEDSPD